MATTNFAPNIGDYENGGEYGAAAFGKTSISFGIPSTRPSGKFAIPAIKFKFYNAEGDAIGQAPTIYMQAPAQFDLQQLARYQETGAIFGSNLTSTGGTVGEDGGISDVVLNGVNIGKSFSEALMASIAASFTNLEGYIRSAGQTGIDQAEFANRAMVNPLQQLLYKGPVFKPYSFNFNLRPRSLEEAQAALEIISTFKIANAAKFKNPEGFFTPNDLLELVGSQPFVFGYPDLVEFELIMYAGDDTGTEETATLYKSKLCAIESIGANYGQQKLTFFDPGTTTRGIGTTFYPTEIAMTLSLKEVVVRTAADAVAESAYTIK